MKRHYRVVARDVTGAESGDLGTYWTRRGARRCIQLHGPIPEPIPGRPMYTLNVEFVT